MKIVSIHANMVRNLQYFYSYQAVLFDAPWNKDYVIKKSLINLCTIVGFETLYYCNIDDEDSESFFIDYLFSNKMCVTL